ncbi:uncharacterized protein J3R85_014704, partial [Psidium guajava]
DIIKQPTTWLLSQNRQSQVFKIDHKETQKEMVLWAYYCYHQKKNAKRVQKESDERSDESSRTYLGELEGVSFSSSATRRNRKEKRVSSIRSQGRTFFPTKI